MKEKAVRRRRRWTPREEIELIDLSLGYFLVKFFDASDMRFALEEGPWMIFGHYLTVREWSPDFRPTDDTIDSTAAWVRFPTLPVKYYSTQVLMAMGNAIGKAVKVDHNTRLATKGRFARVCVEIDLNKPLVPRIYLDGQWQPVEYEGLPMICFKCGRSGHRECPFMVKEDPKTSAEDGGDVNSRKDNGGEQGKGSFSSLKSNHTE